MSSKIFDTVIVGAGVSGLSCAIELKIKNIENIAIVEKSNNFFSTIRSFYKDGKRVDRNWRNQIIELLGNINFEAGLKEDVLNYFEELLEKYNIKPLYNNEVEKIIKNQDDIFEVHLKSDILRAKSVVIAIGKMGKPNKPDYKVPIEIQKSINFNLDNCSKNENILVIGGGNSAAEYAYSLALDENIVTLAYRKENFTRLNPINEKMIKEFEASKKLTIKLNCDINCLEDENGFVKVNYSNGESQNFNRVIYAIGGTAPIDFLKLCGVKIDDNSKPLFNENFECCCKNLYLAGDITSKNEGSISSSLNHGYLIAQRIAKELNL
ncbi:cbb3-type cytochrome oxidase assembly protein CcoS [Aliarcobacter cryaerophilus ATCC 43158]|uniref:NADPH oxidoreductase, putative flavodoxin quinone reductase FqrB n=1 Tax=Aliarcobacter cryaerophilus ATCC 43158 TaxID=1032070 RepID=A0AAD0TYN2_9BACT|nr:NAD(P)-binding domain-containing protein [Aliarcobacter cryaerophilus]AYJ79182.1 NADPH oxidoreductase, putative flavodoxin quinone reductase FqrB [Aliarcobacter cryaerophilus ATCC 43158]PRM94706.1 cbb3-type cytochrome oxidase assembly protein CcoS [Aliarcobacter cryaerophilus]QCZ23448.1 cbb3-type cytochrome oxidase assembly protein CcoS [Aliarcobacter cryaerophilus ATCC 43158]